MRLLFQIFLGAIVCLVSCQNAFAFESVKFKQNLQSTFQNPKDIAVSITGDIFVLDDRNSKIYIFDAAGKLKRDFGSRGSKSGQFNRAGSIDITPEGEIVVADTGNNRIQIFDKNGTFVSMFGQPGLLPGQLKSPNAVAVDQFGFIYVADTMNSRIQIFSSKGVFLWGFKTEKLPVDIALDSQRNLYVLMKMNDSISKYSAAGVKLKSIKCIVSGRNYTPKAVGITVDFRGDIYITEAFEHSVKKIDDNGKILLSLGSRGKGRGQFYDPKGIESNVRGDIFVVDSRNKRVQILQVSGSNKTAMQPQLNSPPVVEFEKVSLCEKSIADIQITKDNVLFCLSDMKNHILKNENGIRMFGKAGRKEGQFGKPLAFYVNNNGSLYVADTNNNRIQIFNKEIMYDYEFGERGSQTGQFNKPSGVVVNSKGIIYIADTGNNRIQIYNADGIFLSAFGKRAVKSSKIEPAKGDFNSPTDLAIDSKDRLYVVDSMNNRIQIFNEDGNFIKSIGVAGTNVGQFKGIADISIDENGFLYVADQGNNRIQIFDKAGEFVMAFGTVGKTPGSFQKISSVSSLQGKIYVSDYMTDQISVFQFHAQGMKKEDRIYVTKTAYLSYGSDASQEEKQKLASKSASLQAEKELAEKLNVSVEHLRKYVKVESTQLIGDDKVSVTVSVLRNIPEEKKKVVVVEKEIVEEEFELM